VSTYRYIRTCRRNIITPSSGQGHDHIHRHDILNLLVGNAVTERQLLRHVNRACSLNAAEQANSALKHGQTEGVYNTVFSALSTSEARIRIRAVHVGFMMDKMALGQTFPSPFAILLKRM
jgi:hypothetical protein